MFPLNGNRTRSSAELIKVTPDMVSPLILTVLDGVKLEPDTVIVVPVAPELGLAETNDGGCWMPTFVLAVAVHPAEDVTVTWNTPAF
jgi:hypothetical protein